jgi:hypothetical protein
METLIPIDCAHALEQKEALNYQLALSKTKQAMNYQHKLDPSSSVALVATQLQEY